MKNFKKKNFVKKSWLYSNQQQFLEYMYQKYLKNPNILESSWKKAFQKIENSNLVIHHKKEKNKNSFLLDLNYYKKYIKEKILKFIFSYRSLGHYISKIDPLNLYPKKNILKLKLSYYNFHKKDLKIIKNLNCLPKKNSFLSLLDIENFYKNTYSNTVGFEYMYLKNSSEKKWLQKYIEKKYNNKKFTENKRIKLLKNLIQSQTFEKFIHFKFPGNKRFSLEGCDVLIPLLYEIIDISFKKKVKKIFLGMAHRGRLNVIHNLFNINVPYMFTNSKSNSQNSFKTGDVKYHMGFQTSYVKDDKKIKLILLNNPSHLEIITPVVLGCCKSEIELIEKIEKKSSILPIIIHGDAAFSGQGIIQETLNMSQVPAYHVLGCIHIIINNQIGFTTSKKKYLRSSTYCTDIAKMIDSPVFHVNADDPESVIFVIKLALEFRFLFKKDVFIDLVGYRRLGHNESDDPFITQPIMYQKIKNHLNVIDLYNNSYFITQEKYKNLKNNLYDKYMKKLKNFLNEKNIFSEEIKKKDSFILKKKSLYSENYKISIKEIKEISKKIFTLPKNFYPHNQIKKIFINRMKMSTGEQKWDWGAVENLAYATLLYQGISCRLTGEDIRRGTFSHRHINVFCQKNGKVYKPLEKINYNNSKINTWDSVLSEESTLAFEYGYSLNNKKILNVWEAQFGDFVNGAQIIIDQFIVSSYQKWGICSALVIMLPHGCEGQGPEHSSARLERYLQLCAQKNICICIPTTTSQFFHLLRKQGLSKNKKPLIIFTPKSLLRNPLTFSKLESLSYNKFFRILLDKNIYEKKVKKIIFCTGKIYYDLLLQNKKFKRKEILIVRIEQLYPFPKKEFKNLIKKFFYINKYIWCQEEPKNQGAWTYFYFYFKKYCLCSSNNKKITYIGRPKWASTAEGDIKTYQKFQNKIINHIFDN